MDATHFDRLARALSDVASRRGFSRNLAVLTSAGILPSLLSPTSTDAKKKKKKCKGKSKKKCGKKCIPKSACCSDADCDNDGETCVSGACTCPEGQDACGGACLTSCPENRVRNPVNCICCRPSNLVENVCDPIHDVCCAAELACGPISGGGDTACEGRAIGQPCSFDEQCNSGFCNPNFVCA